MTTYPAERFSLHKETNTYVAEKSDLGLRVIDRTPQAFQIEGVHAIFSYVSADRDQEGDISGWCYENGPAGPKALIIND